MNITTLPSDLSQFKNLVFLDLSNNPISDYQQTAKSLSTIEKLKQLRIDLTTVDNVEIILRNLPNLKMLNDKPIQTNLFAQENENENQIIDNNRINNSNININDKNENNEIIMEENEFDQKDLPDSSIENEIPNYDVRKYYF